MRKSPFLLSLYLSTAIITQVQAMVTDKDETSSKTPLSQQKVQVSNNQPFKKRDEWTTCLHKMIHSYKEELNELKPTPEERNLDMASLANIMQTTSNLDHGKVSTDDFKRRAENAIRTFFTSFDKKKNYFPPGSGNW